MIKYIVQHLRDETTIHEVNVEEVFTHSWEVKPGEKKYRILSQNFLEPDGSFQVWMSWGVFDSHAMALNSAAGDIRHSMERQAAKESKELDIQALTKKVASVKTKKLEKK